MRRLALVWLLLLAIATAAVLIADESARGYAAFLWGRLRGGYTVEERLSQHGQAVEQRLRATFTQAGLPYPPAELSYLAFKDTWTLEVYARQSGEQPWVYVRSYAILGASGGPGPKLARGDNQVPEGIYGAESLNPNSRFHLSIRLNYPNEFDRQMALADGRTELGSDIMIHGSAASIGCLAVGNQAAEDLFVLAALATKEKLRIVVSPSDFRKPSTGVPMPVVNPAWAVALHGTLRAELQQYRGGS
jgi:hypothetical protein